MEVAIRRSPPPCYLYRNRLSHQLPHELLEDMHMMIDIFLRMLDRDRPLVVETRREEDTAIGEVQPVGIRHIHVDLPPGTVVARPLVAEHGTALRADLRHVHWQIELFDDAL